MRRRPIRIGAWFLLILVAGTAVISAWTVAQVRSGADLVGAISIGAAAGATYSVSLLALVALINLVSWIGRLDYLWVLPSDFADIPLDWPIPLAVAIGLGLGWLFWQ